MLSKTAVLFLTVVSSNASMVAAAGARAGQDCGARAPVQHTARPATRESRDSVSLRRVVLQLDHVSGTVVDLRGAEPTNSEAAVFEARHRRPIVGPDGRQLTYGQFVAPGGDLTAWCGSEGTSVVLRLRGLVALGSYSLWRFVFDAPGWTPSLEAASGAGVRGRGDGRSHAFTASSTGEAFIAMTIPAGRSTSRATAHR